MGNIRRRGDVPSIRYSLATQAAEDGRIEIILDLYRGSVPAVTRRIARVERMHAKTVLSRCQDHLEASGVAAVDDRIFAVRQPPAPPREQPTAAGNPVAAFDWIFQAS